MNNFAKFILLGPRNVGKTNVGKRLSSLIDIPCIDLDDIVREKFGSVTEIVMKNGWENFRKIENTILKNLLNEYNSKDVILILGGGTIAHKFDDLREANIKLLNEFCPSEKVLILPYKNLQRNAKILLQRMNNRNDNVNSKPPLTSLSPEDEMLHILSTRKRYYEDFASYTLYTHSLKEEEVTTKFIRIFSKTHLAGHICNQKLYKI